MDTFESRFPSGGECRRLLLAAAFPIHFWAVFQFLARLPAFLLRLRPGGIWDALAYVLTGALAETAFSVLALVLAAAILPPKALRSAFLPTAALTIYLSAGWAAAFHYATDIAAALTRLISAPDFLTIYLAVLGSILTGYVATVLLVPRLIRARPAVRRGVEAFAERSEVLSTLFLLADAAGVLTVLLHNRP